MLGAQSGRLRTFSHDCRTSSSRKTAAYARRVCRLTVRGLSSILIVDLRSHAHDRLHFSTLERTFSRLLLPEETRVCVGGERGDLFYVISPDHEASIFLGQHSNFDRKMFCLFFVQGSLFTFSRIEHPCATSRSPESPWSEAQARRVFAQMCRLVSLCHRVGIYLRDFRLQKIVYTNRQK